MSSDSQNSPLPAAVSGGDGRLRPLEWARAAGAEDIVEREMRAGVRRRMRRRVAGFGAALVALMIAGSVWRMHELAPRGAPAFVSAPTRQVLPDGSVVELNGASRVSVDFSAAVRRVVLDRGEAHFAVTKDPARSFVVVARGVEVRAVGTAFSVQLESARVEVVVTEGRVRVAPGAGATEAPASVLVEAGQQVSVQTEQAAPAVGVVERVGPPELAERLAWRVPRLELNFTPLSAVLPVVNSHGGARLVLASPELGELKLTGSLRASNVPVLLQILESSYGVVADRRPDGEIVLRRGD